MRALTLQLWKEWLTRCATPHPILETLQRLLLPASRRVPVDTAEYQRALAYAIRAIEERDELRDAVMSFMEKWEQVQPAIDSAFTMSYVHGGRYTGPTIAPELERFNALLKGERTDV